MCGRFTQTAAFDVLAERFGITVESGTNEELTARYNVAPSQEVPIVVSSNGNRRLVMAKWGFRPPWVKDSKLAPINARAETVAMSRLFGAWKLIRGQKRKQPYFIRLKGGTPFAFAGLWTPPHLAPPTCTIIRTDANELLAPIHPRMPVILDSEDEALWLDSGCVAPIKVLPCQRPFPSERIVAIPVSSLVSSPGESFAMISGICDAARRPRRAFLRRCVKASDTRCLRRSVTTMRRSRVLHLADARELAPGTPGRTSVAGRAPTLE